jgi:ATP-dependent Clp protease ATP-binding subunit ClpC
MFERYTKKARRVIFFARYEASNFGSPYIETEHLLLGILREAKDVALRFQLSAESIRNQIDGATVIREKVSTSVDLPLSNESKRVLAYAAEEAESLGHKHIGTDHLLVGLLREEKSFAAELLREACVHLKEARKQLAASTGEPSREVGVLVAGGQHAPTIESVEDGQPVTGMMLVHPALPRIGEELVLRFEDGDSRAYRVQDLRFVYTHRLEKIEVLVKRVPSP